MIEKLFPLKSKIDNIAPQNLVKKNNYCKCIFNKKCKMIFLGFPKKMLNVPKKSLVKKWCTEFATKKKIDWKIMKLLSDIKINVTLAWECVYVIMNFLQILSFDIIFENHIWAYESSTKSKSTKKLGKKKIFCCQFVIYKFLTWKMSKRPQTLNNLPEPKVTKKMV